MILERISSALTFPRLFSATLVAAANMIPIPGVMLWEWNLYDLLALWWGETLLLVVVSLLRVFAARGSEDSPPRGGRWPGALFFLFHFALFAAVHGFFVFTLIGEKDFWNYPPIAFLLMLIEVFGRFGGILALFFLAHFVVFAWNDFALRGYRRTDPHDILLQPYPRAVLLHIAILFSAFAIELAGPNLWLLLGLVAGKAILDLAFHLYAYGAAEQT